MFSHFTRWRPAASVVYFVAGFGPFCGDVWYPFPGGIWFTLSYHLQLYQTDEAIVFPPNGEGILKIIFSVEMRIPPWLHIEFANLDYSAEVVVRKTTHLTFKVIDKTHNQHIRRAEDIKITQLILDANIYEDDSIAPPNCI